MPDRSIIDVRFIYILLVLIPLLVLRDRFATYQAAQEVSFSQFYDWLNEGKIQQVVISDQSMRGTLTESTLGGSGHFVTTIVEDDIAKLLADKGVEFRREIPDTFWRGIFSWVLPLAIFMFVWIFLMRRIAGMGGAGGQLMSIGKSKAKVYVEANTGVTFLDVAGVDEAKAELIEIVEFLKDQKKFSRLGARMPKGVLLVGPPGTGKTLLARAVAGEAAVPFFSISGSEFVEMFVGVGAARVRDLFEKARLQSPCIIFIDELDALGRLRTGNSSMGGHDEKEQTLNQLLVEMDGFDVRSGIVLLAATNRPEILDPALLRAGRFDRQVLVDRPDREGRKQILKVHTHKIQLDQKVDLDEIASMSPGFTGADLANLVNEAALVATRREADSVSNEDFTKAIERLVAGLEKRNRVMSNQERKMVAYHEVGHAFVSSALLSEEAVHKVSIIPRGMGALGYTMQRPISDRYLWTHGELKSKIAVLLGGRAAELIFFDQLSTGAADDLSRATEIARNMVTRYGMGAELGHASYEEEINPYLGGTSWNRARNYSEHSSELIDQSVRESLNEGLETAETILKVNRDLLNECAQMLLSEETMDREQLEPFFKRIKNVQKGSKYENNWRVF